MKRNELRVGEELYYARERDWATPEHGSGYGARVKVLAVVPWKHFPRSNEEQKFGPCDSGNGVLVERAGGTWNHGKPYRDVVPLAHLKGGYDAINAEVERWCKQRDESKATAENARLDRRSRAVAARNAIGVIAEVTYNGVNVTVDLKTFEAMAAALAGHGWRYEP